MLGPIIIFVLLAAVMMMVNRRQNKHVEGAKSGFKQLINVLPLILIAFVLAGMIEAIIPEEFVRQWLAREAGLNGVVLGTVGGMLLAMGPYAAYPIIASIYSAGAGLGTTIALVTGWTILSLSRTPYEIGFLGVKFAVIRMGLGLPFCLLTGATAHCIDILWLG